MSESKRTILGLDVGVASIGWGVVKLTEKSNQVENQHTKELEDRSTPTGYEILGAGVRLFNKSENREGKTLSNIRGSARRARRTIRRKAKRMEAFLNIAKKQGLLASSFDVNNKALFNAILFKNNPDIWSLRVKALDECLSNIEFVRVLYHILKHRGFYFTSKLDSENNDSKVKSSLANNEDKAKLYRTIGEYIAKQPTKRNTEGDYQHSIKRELLEKEIEEIFLQQKSFNNQYATDSFKKQVVNNLYSTAPIDKKLILSMVGKCSLEVGENLAPVQSYSNEYFVLWSKLNNLEILPKKEKLSFEKKELISNKVFKENKNKITFKQLREFLDIDDNSTFNLCSYNITNPEYKKYIVIKDTEKNKAETNVKVYDEKGEITDVNLSDNPAINKCKSVKISYMSLRNLLKLKDMDRFVELESDYLKTKQEYQIEDEKKGTKNFFNQFEKDTFFEAKGYFLLQKTIQTVGKDDSKEGTAYWETIQDSTDILNSIAEALCYYKEDKHRIDYLKEKNIDIPTNILNKILTLSFKGICGHSFKALNKLIPHLKEGLVYSDAKEKSGYSTNYSGFTGNSKYLKHEFTVHKNPTINRIFSQLRKLVNAINKEYTKKDPNFCIDQINIETAKELKNSKKKLEKIKKDISDNKNENALAKELAKDYSDNISPFLIKLLIQQGGNCPYCGEYKLGSNYLDKDSIEIDHILPFSKSMNDSQNNKVAVCKTCNQNKKNRTPYEWFKEDNKEHFEEKWQYYKNTVNNMKGLPFNKKRTLLEEGFFSNSKKDAFLSRDLVNAAYASKFIIEYLKNNFDFTQSAREDIKNKIQVRNGRITALLRNSWSLPAKDRNEDYHHAVDALVLAFSTQGMVHFISNQVEAIEKVGQNAAKFLRQGLTPYKKDFNEKEREKFKEDFKNTIDSIFISQMPRRKVTKSYHDDWTYSLNPNPKKKKGIERKKYFSDKEKSIYQHYTTEQIKSELKEKDEGFFLNKVQGIAKKGEVVRGDLFQDTQGKHYVVPIYGHHLAYSKNKLPLPNIATDGTDISNEKEYKFKFSLYKDDLIAFGKITDSKEPPKLDYHYINFIAAELNLTKVKTKEIVRGSYKTKTIIKKYNVDMLGNIVEVKKEKRIGNITKLPKDKRKKKRIK